MDSGGVRQGYQGYGADHAAIPVGAAFGEVSWGYCLSVSGVAAILSLLTSLATLPVLDEDASAATKGDDEHVE